MGQTLSHGVYLPNEGERNCYAGLASNWQILNTAVGAIAEKAPLVHTHTVSQITDFPAYGTTAGTICEGNDSRLSDARTPLVHTHTKSDVTDLFNSANTWSANNTYSADCIIYNSDSSGSVARLQLRNSKAEVLSTGNTKATQSITFGDKNDFSFGYIYGAVQSNGVAVKIGTYAKDSSDNTVNTELQILSFTNGNKALFPATADVYDLGLSSYQWKSIFAKNYYYNGTAWGLDKANTWTGINNFSTLTLFNNSVTYNEAPSSSVELPSIRIFGGGRYCGAFDYLWKSTGENVIRLSLGSYKSDGTFGYWSCNFGVPRDFSNGGAFGTPAFYPGNDNAYNLGDSTHRWKTLNGVNPGALSLPDYSHPTFLDVTAQGLNWHTDATPNFYEIPANGYFAVIVQCPNISNGVLDIFVNNTGIGSSDHGTYAGNELFCYVPVIKGSIVRVRARCDKYYSVTFYPCLGNV